MQSEHGAPELSIKVFEDPDLVVIRLAGEFDLASSRDVEAILRDCERKARSTVLIDLEELRFIDSTGLRTLLEAKRRADSTRSKRPLPPWSRRTSPTRSPSAPTSCRSAWSFGGKSMSRSVMESS